MNKKLPFVSIITVNHNGKHLLEECFESLYKLNYPKGKFEIIMVDNCSADGSAEYVRKKYPKIKIIANGVNNYCRANNLAIKKTRGDFVVLLNNDTKVDKNWLIELVMVVLRDETIASVGSKILFADGKINSVGHRELPNYYWADLGYKEEDVGQYDEVCQISSICGGSALFRKKAIEGVGLFDEDFNMYMEDVDIAISLKKQGWKIFYYPHSIVYHKFHGTATDELVDFYIERNRLLLVAKYYPEKLGEALFGRGYFTVTNNINNPNDIHNILSPVFSKLLKHHDNDRINAVVPDLFSSLKKILNLEKDYLVKAFDAETKKLQAKDKEIIVKKTFIQEREDQLKLIDEQLKQKINEICLKDKDIFQREAALKERDSALQQRGQQIDQLNVQLQQASAELQLEAKQITNKDNQLQEKDNQLKELNEQLKQKINELRLKRETVENLLLERTQLMSAVTNKDKEIIHLRSTADNFYSTETFRYIIRPLWKVMDFLKSIKHTVFRKNSFKKADIDTKRILFIKPQRISVEDTEKALKEYKKRYPGSNISILANLLRNDFDRLSQNKTINEKIFYCPDAKKFSVSEQIKLAFKLPKRKYDYAVVLIDEHNYSGHRKAEMLAFLSGSRKTGKYFVNSQINFNKERAIEKTAIGRFIVKDIISSTLNVIFLLGVVVFFLVFIVGNLKLRKATYRLRNLFKR